MTTKASKTTATATATKAPAKTSTDKADTSKATPAPTSKYIVNWQLRHDGKVYEQGDTVELTNEQANALLPTGVLVKQDKG